MPPVDDPFEQLLRSHRRLEERLAHMTRAIADLDQPRAQMARDYLVESLDWMDRAVRRHELDEEQSLFPRLQGRADLTALIKTLSEEHVLQQASADALRAALPNDVTAARQHFAALAASYAGHVAREENELFVAARAHLSAEELARMSEEMNARRGR